jgi:hypothetical protein
MDRPMQELLRQSDPLGFVATTLFDTQVSRDVLGFAKRFLTPFDLARVFGETETVVSFYPTNIASQALLEFCTQLAYARIIPWESSPLGAESLATLAASSVKAGTVTLGATVGFIAAGKTPLLLITVPLGIVLCGASVSFAKWIEENRSKVWSRMSPFRDAKDHHYDHERGGESRAND